MANDLAREEQAGELVKQSDPLMEVAKKLFVSGLFAVKNPLEAYAKISLGQQYGLSPAHSLTQIDVIEGKPSESAALVAALIQRSGIYDYEVLESTTEKCVISFYKRRDGEWCKAGMVTWTMADARRADLATKKNWIRYPRQMLAWRALTEGARIYTPAVFCGSIYTPDELGRPVSSEDITEGDFTVEEVADE